MRLLGYVDKGNERIIITEYVPNGTLREHLDGKFLTFEFWLITIYFNLDNNFDIALHVQSFLFLVNFF